MPNDFKKLVQADKGLVERKIFSDEAQPLLLIPSPSTERGNRLKRSGGVIHRIQKR